MLTIYHNGSCSKCGGALEILQQQNIPHQVRWYITDPLSESELSDLLRKLKLNPSELLRKNEQLYTELFEGKNLSEEEWLQVLLNHPELMQRPIIDFGSLAIIARPPEKLLEYL